jgi:acetylornithine deacetylase/succinyl-diaminopimelate desuccinylase-like protein
MDIYSSYFKKLKSATAIKSISTDKKYSKELLKQVKWVEKEFKKAGFKVKKYHKYGNTILLGTLNVNKNYPTVLHYGHYDIQPAHQTKQDKNTKKNASNAIWKTDPFKVVEKDKKLYGRGVVDNKGQFLVYLTAVEALKKANKLKYNVKFIVEGNEETGSGKLAEFIKDNKKDLKCDFALISDGEQINKQPTVDVSYRGTINAQLTLYGAKNDLHSGLYGGIILNPANELCNTLSQINGRALCKNLDAPKISKSHKENLLHNNFNLAEFTKITGLKYPMFKDAKDIYRTLGFSIAVEITGLKSGYTEEGFRNAIPHKASAKINLRYPGDYKPNIMEQELRRVVNEAIPEVLDYKLEIKDKAHGITLNVDNKYHKKAEELLKKVYKKDVLYNYCGATLPVSYDLTHTLKVPAVFVGLANLDCNMHGANENFDIALIKKGLDFVTRFLST